ncbi:hypothetical protein RhiirA4_541705 [Rhizophagus irregularis]|uniref:Sacsin/Nov domain-containing protein n=1 Tax=Rhizophagus irregularis TaxID=588596 RepID=A0A2I1GCB2_9GLOM|nr:hypothetical protein RhiirA4_541705 [Rhizophagus irregularis]
MANKIISIPRFLSSSSSSKIDEDDLRNQVLKNASGEQRVEVNQRHLIDKILARYSAKFVIFRELMQNSDDAKSTKVQIFYETANPGKDIKLKDKIARIKYKNNGFIFRSEDWDRLKKLPKGTLMNKKYIGAFGVGFYSLFSICEEPFVTSGKQGMTFYWRGNQLLTKQARINNDDKVWTTFLLDMREKTEEFPEIDELARFLANSLGFTGNLNEVTVYFNNIPVIELSKTIQNSVSMGISSEFDTYSPQKMFHLTSIDVKDVQLTVKKLIIPENMDNWRSLPITNFEMEEVFVSLKIVSGNLDVKVSNAFSNEMERSTKKKPPSKTTIQVIYTGYDEHMSSVNHENIISSIFEDLHPFPNQGRIYIGFPTHQTTGCCIHLAARVERESIDLVDKTLSIYNSELLSLAGTLCRVLYDREMSSLTQLYNDMINVSITNTEEQVIKTFLQWLENQAEHALTHFTFKESTPNAEVSRILESQFFKCSKKILSIYSTNGVLPITDVRIPNPEMERFIKTVPLVPKLMYDRCKKFFMKAKDSLKLIKELSIKDVLFELKSRSLSEEEIVDLLKWWISYRSKGNNVDSLDVKQFMQLARIGNNSQPLNTIHYFLNPDIVPSNMDIPTDVLPYNISKNFTNNKDLETWFKWKELSLVNWARFIVEKPDLERDPNFAREVHITLAKRLSNISPNDKKIICRLFEKKKCIPTKFGMKIPANAYFQDVNLLPDLPTIDFQEPSSVQSLMELLGVRKIVELQLIFDHLLKQGDGDHIQLVKYLSSKFNDLKENEIKILKKKPIWPKENFSESSKDRYVADQLYTPIPLHREFGLPVIDWKGDWNRYTQEGTFLIELGLREFPELQKILKLLTPQKDPQIRAKAFKYFALNFKERYSKDYKSTEINVAFLLCSSGVYAKPTECYINPECMKMNFNVIHQDLLFYSEQFGVQENPSHEKLLKSLIDHPPRDINKAKEIFEYLFLQGNFTSSDWKILGDLNFIPVKDRTKFNAITLKNPRSCFLKCTEYGLREFFTYVNFGEKANVFLRICGVKNEPSTIEFAELLVKSSRELWNSLNSSDDDRYSNILSRIANEITTIEYNEPGLFRDMKREPILIGIKKICDGERVDQKHLASAKEIFINDDPGYRQIFKPLIAPEDISLERFYKRLGCRSLHESVKETVIPKGAIRETEVSVKIRNTIEERANLFYYDNSRTNILRNEKWLERLKVRTVDQIETCHKLDNNIQIRNDFTTACVLESAELNSWVLFITPNPDYLDISSYICKHIFKSSKLKEYSHFNIILTTPSLSSLEAKGIPVDRLLRSNSSQNVVKQYSQKPAVKSPVVITPQITLNLRNSLRDAIKTCHSNLGSTINSQACTKVVTESESSYCDIIPGHLLFCVGNEQGIELYDAKSANQADILSSSNRAPLIRFLIMLRNIASVFDLELRAIHVFYDNYTNSVAFNRDRSLFFNLKFYIGLHGEECKTKFTSNAMTSWYMTFCHELAHNFIQSHSSEHEMEYERYQDASFNSVQSTFLVMSYDCKGECNSNKCRCKKAGGDYSSRCHSGRSCQNK